MASFLSGSHRIPPTQGLHRSSSHTLNIYARHQMFGQPPRLTAVEMKQFTFHSVISLNDHVPRVISFSIPQCFTKFRHFSSVLSLLYCSFASTTPSQQSTRLKTPTNILLTLPEILVSASWRIHIPFSHQPRRSHPPRCFLLYPAALYEI